MAQADVLSIFGRDGLALATLWDPPTLDQTGAFAFRMYRNYDGAHGRFGDLGIQPASTDQMQLSVYAARRSSDSALTVLVVNKSLTQTLTSALSLSVFFPAPLAAVYRDSAADLHSMVHEPSQVVSINGFTADYPPSSITLYVLSSRIPLIPRLYLPAITRAQ